MFCSKKSGLHLALGFSFFVFFRDKLEAKFVEQLFVFSALCDSELYRRRQTTFAPLLLFFFFPLHRLLFDMIEKLLHDMKSTRSVVDASKIWSISALISLGEKSSFVLWL